MKYFSDSELQCKGTGVIKLDPRFSEALVTLREAWGKPLITTSVCRSPSHNAKIGGHPNSLHLTENPKWPTFGTMACDIGWRGWSFADRRAFAKLALAHGWRVGLHDAFCHIDRLLDIEPNAVKVFLYGTYTGKLNAKELLP